MPDVGALRDDIIAAASARRSLTYRLDPPPDGVTTTDCSLLVVDSARAAGAALPAGVRTAEQIRQACTVVGWEDVQPADLLFFEQTYPAGGEPGPDGKLATHVGFSLGAHTMRMLDAHERDAGPPDVAVTDISTDYWQDKIIEARRLPALVEVVDTGGDPGGDSLDGIDVAVYQGNPDWDAVKASGISFAFTKATQGVSYVNPTFGRNWSEMARVGLVRGAYHFAEPDVNTPRTEVDHFLATVQANGWLQPGDLLALDLEDFQGSLARANDVGGWALAFLRGVERLVGFKPLLYTAPNVIAEHSLFGYPALAEYPLWLASYRETMPPAPKPWQKIAVWQTSNEGSVPGISGDVDLDVSYRTVEQLRALGKPAAEVTPAPAPSPASAPDQLAGLINAVAYLADDVAAIEDHGQRVAEAQRVREQFVGPKA